MKHSVRILAAAAAVILTAALTGCGDKRPTVSSASGVGAGDTKLEQKYLDNGGVPFTDLGGMTLKIGCWYDPSPMEASTNAAAAAAWERIRYLEETYHCKIEFQTMVQDQMIAQITSSVAAKKPVVDICVLQSRWAYSLINQGMLQNFNDLSRYLDPAADKFAPFVSEMGRYKGGSYLLYPGVPVPRSVLFFNKRLLGEKKLESPYNLYKNGDWTFRKLQEYAVALTEDKDGDSAPDVWGLTGYGVLRDTVIQANGGSWVSLDKTTGKATFTMNSPQAIEAFSWLCNLKNQYNCVYEPSNPTWDYYTYAFESGEAAMLTMELYMAGSLSEMEDDYGIVPLPVGPSGKDMVSVYNVFEVTTMLANNPNAEKVAFLYDLYTEPYAELGDEVWRSNWERWVRDEESLDALKKASDGAVFNEAYIHEEAYTNCFSLLNSVWNNTQTMGQALAERGPAIQAYLDDLSK